MIEVIFFRLSDIDKNTDQIHILFRGAVLSLTSTYQVTSVTFGDNSDQIISGGIDNVVKVWDLRKTNSDGSKNTIGPNHKPVHELTGHNDTITGLSLSPDGMLCI